MKFLRVASSFLNNLRSSNSDGQSTISIIGHLVRRVFLTVVLPTMLPLLIIGIIALALIGVMSYKLNVLQFADSISDSSSSSNNYATGTHGAIVEAAKTQLGVPYSFVDSYYCPRDGNHPNCTSDGPGFNCSGLAKWAYEQAGFDISYCQSYAHCGEGSETYMIQSRGHWHDDISQCAAGDLIFFSYSGDWMNTYHVGIYMGDEQMIHANGTEVAISYYNSSGNFVGCGWPLD